MFEQDYIMREIKQFSQFLEQVLFKKKEGKTQEALDIIEQSLQEFFEGEELDFHELSLSDTISALETNGTFNADLAFIIADLLYEKAELIKYKNSKKNYLKALLLYKKAKKSPGAAFPIEATQKISRIKKDLDQSDLQKINRLL